MQAQRSERLPESSRRQHQTEEEDKFESWRNPTNNNSGPWRPQQQPPSAKAGKSSYDVFSGHKKTGFESDSSSASEDDYGQDALEYDFSKYHCLYWL